jgi:hypothetical protein
VLDRAIFLVGTKSDLLDETRMLEFENKTQKSGDGGGDGNSGSARGP